MNNTNIIIARDRKNKILRFTGIEDWYEILREFRECMSRNNHAGVLSGNDYDEPVEPVAALNRLRNMARAPPLPTDQRDKTDFVKAMKIWTNSCTAVLCSLLNMLSIEVTGRLEATDLNLTEASRTNIERIIDWINYQYGGWSDSRGTRNYDEMKSIPNFTSVESTNEGFRKLKLLIEERNGWRDQSQRYTDAFYKNWLLLRMEDWPKLEFERNIIQGAPNMPFAVAKSRVLEVIKLIQEKLYMSRSRHFNDTPIKEKDTEPNIDMDSIALNFHGNTTQRPPYPRSQTPMMQTDAKRCFNCGLTSHSQYNCNSPWCSSCKQTWTSIKDANYHKVYLCPNRSEPDKQKPVMQAYKRPLQTSGPSQQTEQRPYKQPYKPRQAFPPRGTMAPRPMKANATSSSYTHNDQELDYNDIQALRAFDAQVQGSQYIQEEYEQQLPADEENDNPQDADWDPDQAL